MPIIALGHRHQSLRWRRLARSGGLRCIEADFCIRAALGSVCTRHSCQRFRQALTAQRETRPPWSLPSRDFYAGPGQFVHVLGSDLPRMKNVVASNYAHLSRGGRTAVRVAVMSRGRQSQQRCRGRRRAVDESSCSASTRSAGLTASSPPAGLDSEYSVMNHQQFMSSPDFTHQRSHPVFAQYPIEVVSRRRTCG